MIRLGLRAKSGLALGGCILVALLLALAAGWQELHAVEERLGSAFVRNVTQYNKQRILTPVLRELALSQRLADSEVTRRWLEDENNPEKKALFFAEAERYRNAFADRSYFVIVRATRHYYFNDDHSKFSDQPRYSLKANEPQDAWFFATMKQTENFNINVDADAKLGLTKVWFNVLSKDRGANIGLAGTGLDLTTFLNRFINTSEAGVTPMILNRTGAIQAHPDHKLIDYSSITEKVGNRSTIYRLLTRPEDETVVRDALRRAETGTDQIPVFWAELNGQREMLADSYIPELKWHVLTAVNLKAARVLDPRVWAPFLLIGFALLALLLVALLFAVNRMLLTPLLRLTNSARSIAAGNYAVKLPAAGSDELGELNRAFTSMAEQVRSHTDELESKVSQRTQELVGVNQQMAEANKKIQDSIQYASLIQNSILPDHDLAQELPGQYFVIWRPRDVVGGDFYLFRATESGFLIGVWDCAGHGVPGAFMTMTAHAAIDVALEDLGPADPAALLRQVDERVRAMLQTELAQLQVAAHMDAGLVFLDVQAKKVTYSGARISLYWSDGESVGEIKSAKRAIGGKVIPDFTNETIKLDPNVTFYLTTDGLLDQSGGPRGYGFGPTRFAALLRRCARRPFTEQQTAFKEELSAYQGEFPQRDDITVLGFRFPQKPER